MATKKKGEVQKPLPASLGGEETLVDPDAKANFWKPKVKDETRIGKLLAYSDSQFGKVLNLETADGPCIIPVSVVMKKTDWERFVGRNIFFQYKGTVKRYKTYFVKALAK